jgi:isocitrate dehydrogenase
LALYWAEALAAQEKDGALKEKFEKLAESLAESESKIVDELNAVQGSGVDLDGYFFPDKKKVAAIMRPSETLNQILAEAY